MTRAPETTHEEPALSGKTFLRQEEFRSQRALSPEPKELLPEDGTKSPYLLGSMQKEELAVEAPPAPGVVWRSLGPAGIPAGQTYGSGPGATTTVAGRVTAIAVDPGDSKHLLVGSAAGGVWETRDTGATWAPRTDDQPTLSIGALAFDPSNPSTVYAGTGEGNSEYAQLGQGILRSSDGGSTWTVVAREVFAGIGFYRLVVDPRDGNRLLVATTGGAAVSDDAGKSWALLHRGQTWDISLAEPELGKPDDAPEILLAAPDGLFAAKGSAAPARVALPGLPASLNPDRERMAVAHVPTSPGQAFAFAASGGKAHLWHRRTAEEPFVPVPLPSFPVGEYVKDVLSVDQASYDWYAAVPARSDDVLYLGAIELVKGERHHADWSWSDISSRQQHGDSIHPDQHTMAFDPNDPDVIYAGSDGGIFRSPDGGGSWESLNAGLAISEVEYLTQRPDEPTWILAGLQDNGTVRRDAEGQWAQVGLGDGGDCATNMAEPDTCFHSYFYMYLERSTSRGDPESWQNVTPPGSNETKKLFYPPLEANGSLVAKAGEVVYLSKDSGDSWDSVPLPPTGDGKSSIASALAIPDADRVLVGTIRGDVFRIDAAGAGWSAPVKLARPNDGWISDLLVDADTPARYWVTVSNPGSVFRSDDEGAGWTDVTANLPAMPVNAIVSDPADRARVWVACDVGVFESRDAGGSWSVYGAGLPNALAEDLAVYGSGAGRLLRVGTRSRGVWEASV
ncbi:MAG TPA: hypothetical protein VF085_11450 [Solirubrobacterales bacterium]